MDRNEAHRLARILDGENDGRLIDNLIDVVEEQKFYRPSRVTHVDTPSTAAGGAYEADNCIHCHASYGHKIYCPVISRETAEAVAAFNGNPSEGDKLHAHALGVAL